MGGTKNEAARPLPGPPRSNRICPSIRRRGKWWENLRMPDESVLVPGHGARLERLISSHFRRWRRVGRSPGRIGRWTHWYRWWYPSLYKIQSGGLKPPTSFEPRLGERLNCARLRWNGSTHAMEAYRSLFNGNLRFPENASHEENRVHWPGFLRHAPDGARRPKAIPPISVRYGKGHIE